MLQRLTRQRRLSDRGFSFIELLAYMAIAALLILAAIPQFNQYRQKAAISNLENDVHNASLATEATATDSGTISLDQLQAAVAKLHLSNASTQLNVNDDGNGEYDIVGTNTNVADTQVVYSSTTNADKNLQPGIQLVKAAPAAPGGGYGGGYGGATPLEALACTPSGVSTPAPVGQGLITNSGNESNQSSRGGWWAGQWDPNGTSSLASGFPWAADGTAKTATTITDAHFWYRTSDGTWTEVCQPDGMTITAQYYPTFGGDGNPGLHVTMGNTTDGKAWFSTDTDAAINQSSWIMEMTIDGVPGNIIHTY